MKVYELTRMLTADTEVKIIDDETQKALYIGCASAATFTDDVKDWDFSEKHIIYI